MSNGTVVLALLILMVFWALPAWSHSKNWSYFPSGGLGLIAAILIILLCLGKI
jgi:hypothetical protein